MHTKKLPMILISMLLSLLFAVNASRAGNVQRNRWEGVAIGIGAAILGNALINHHRYSQPSHPAAYYPRHPRIEHRYHHPRPPRLGHWEIRNVWVPPTHKRVWNPAHHTRKGKWVPGCWIEIVDQPGYWEERRVRVSRR